MSEPISDPAYWRGRLEASHPDTIHTAVFRCPLERWKAIEESHRRILATTIGPNDSVLDAGCGWGRLLDLMPPEWSGYYLGVDLSSDFIEKAKPRAVHHHREFVVADLRELRDFLECKGSREGGGFDWAVLVSIRPMVKRNLGDAEWTKMEVELRRVARRLLYLEYDPDDLGSIE